MTRITAPKSVGQATSLLERYAELDGQLAAVEARRTRFLARANAVADAKAAPLIAELGDLRGVLQPWWQGSGQALAAERKSIQLGGCMIGSRSGKPGLRHTFASDDDAVTALRGTRYGKLTTRVKYTLDRASTLKLLQLKGKAGTTIAELGFSIGQDETFYIARVEQSGTIAV